MNPADGPAAPVILVLEPTPNWLPELQRAFPEAEIKPLESGKAPAPNAPALVVLDAALLTGRIEELERWGRMGSAETRVVVLVSRSEWDAEWLLREFGVDVIPVQDQPRRDVLAILRRKWLALTNAP